MANRNGNSLVNEDEPSSRILKEQAEELRKTLAGRLRLKLLEDIAGEPNIIPTEENIQQYRLNDYRTNNLKAKLTYTFLTLKDCYARPFSDIEGMFSIPELLAELRRDPLEKQLFVELNECPFEILPSCLGVVVTRAELKEGGYVYDISFLAEEGFPNAICGYVVIEPGSDDLNIKLATFEEGKYISYDLQTYSQSWQVELALHVLKGLTEWRKAVLMSTDELSKVITVTKDRSAKVDKRFDELCKAVYKGEVKCTQMRVPFSLIKPYDLDFCLEYPIDIIKFAARDLKRGLRSYLAVYWDGHNFIMNDDYSDYLAYRSLKSDEAYVAVMGDFPEGVGEIFKSGGHELMPPVSILRLPDNNELQISKDSLLDERLEEVDKEFKPTSNHSSLFTYFVTLANLITDPLTKERELHNFILDCPVVFDAYGFGIMSEARLRDKYRVDLIIQYGFNDKRILLVELERATHRIFTKKGRTQAYVTHAMQQVEDAMRWWRENPNDVPKSLDSSFPVEGLVVIGRSNEMSEDDRRRLIHLNHNRNVKVITYDDLLDRIENLMRNLRRSERMGRG